MEAKLESYNVLLGELNQEHEAEEALAQMDWVVRPVVLGLIFLVGITGNIIILLLVFVNHEDMRTGPNVMIINLNISDILGLVFNILLYILQTTVDWRSVSCIGSAGTWQ